MSCFRKNPRGGRPPKSAPIGQPTITQAFGMVSNRAKRLKISDNGVTISSDEHHNPQKSTSNAPRLEGAFTTPTRLTSSNLFEDALSTKATLGPNTASNDESGIQQIIGKTIEDVISAICVGRMAVSQWMMHWLRDLNAQQTADEIMLALRQPTKQLIQKMANKESISLKDLLNIRGNIRDQSQGVYLDVVTTPGKAYGLYTGGAAATVASSRSFRGLYRRIGKHLSSSNRESRPCTHYEWIDRPGNKANFVILAVFTSIAPKQLIYFTETLMTILFETYGNEEFHRLRPSLSVVGGIPLNKDTPLRTELHADDNLVVAAKREQGRRDGAAKTAQIKQNRALRTALKGGPVKLSAQEGRMRFKILALPWIGIPAHITKSWALKGGDEVNVVYDIYTRGMHKQKFAEDGTKDDDGSSLGIQIMQGEKQAWLSRKGDIAVRMTNTIVDWLSGLPTDSEIFGDDRYPLHTVR